jgi:hypothetical protein
MHTPTFHSHCEVLTFVIYIDHVEWGIQFKFNLLQGILDEILNLLLFVDFICSSSLSYLQVTLLITTIDLKLKYKLCEQPLFTNLNTTEKCIRNDD